MMEEYRSIREKIGIPVYLDEDVCSAGDVARAACARGIDGVNIKLAKMGGLREGIRAIHAARTHGLQVLLGCFFESSLGIAGSAHLLGLVDHVDLDAPLHITDDPYEGLEYQAFRVRSPQTAGLGVRNRRGI
jgi:L-Ala-D/L-Glu epimerase